MNISRYEVPPDKLRWQCDPAIFDFDCTKELAPLGEFIGQNRAIRAIEFGLSMNRDGYNIYVAGLTGTGKTSAVKSHIKRLIEEKQGRAKNQHLKDWCYLYNFNDLDRPRIAELPQGGSRTFREQISNLLRMLQEELSKTFSSEEYKNQSKKSADKIQAEQQKLIDAVKEETGRQGFSLQITSLGPVLVPMVNGKPMSQEDFNALNKSIQKDLEKKRNALVQKLQTTFEKAHELEGETSRKFRELDREVADYTVSQLFDQLRKEYKWSEKIISYLNDLKSFTLDNLDIFKQAEEPPTQQIIPGIMPYQTRDPFLPFQVNVFVDNRDTSGIPVITEPNPNYANLFGKIERRFLLGGYLSDHTMLKAGTVHQANGGYLLLSARDVLTNPAVWPTLKRIIKTKEIRIEDPFEQLGFIAPQGLRPQPMPIDVKIVLIGDEMLYQLLAMYDEDFWEIFKVKAEFDSQINKTKKNMVSFAAFIAGCCEENDLRHFDRTGCAKVIEYTSRVVSDQKKMSSRFAWIKELVEEAEYWAGKGGAKLVSARHVEKAIEERRFRHNLPDERIKEMIHRGIIMIDVDGAVVGQVNGLSVYMFGDVVFGRPSRITCKTFLGRGGVINIEREAQLSGSIHDKGVLILSGHLGWKYAQDTPLSLSASLCFEQSYEGVDGDSASSAECYALLSSLSGAPLRQDTAVTGSVNQKGELQAIGGVNQKIEGFFQVCQAKGLTGSQGVIIPRPNLPHLMLREEVIAAAREGKFHIYSVSNVDEGIEILTGLPAGKRRKDGTYPRNSINCRVQKQLGEMAEKLRQFSAPAEDKKGKRKKR
ncbi:Lon protease family protein [Chloroflexota bacterium]